MGWVVVRATTRWWRHPATWSMPLPWTPSLPRCTELHPASGNLAFQRRRRSTLNMPPPWNRCRHRHRCRLELRRLPRARSRRRLHLCRSHRRLHLCRSHRLLHLCRSHRRLHLRRSRRRPRHSRQDDSVQTTGPEPSTVSLSTTEPFSWPTPACWAITRLRQGLFAYLDIRRNGGGRRRRTGASGCSSTLSSTFSSWS